LGANEAMPRFEWVVGHCVPLRISLTPERPN
jgi:hypothetical protein